LSDLCNIHILKNRGISLNKFILNVTSWKYKAKILIFSIIKTCIIKTLNLTVTADSWNSDLIYTYN